MEWHYKVRIQEAVFDFITDFKGNHVLFNFKQFKCSKPKIIVDPNIVGQEYMMDSDEIKQYKKDKLKQLSCSVYCKLCGLIFKKDEASKILT